MAPDGSGRKNTLARSSGYCQLIHSRRPPTSPSGTRRRCGPRSLSDGAENLVYGVEADAADQMNVHCVRRRYSAACNDGGRMVSTPSAAVAEIVVRTM
jgi:hypothetical protein